LVSLINPPFFRFESYVFVPGLWPPAASYEQTNIFLLSCAASIIAAIVFSKGAPYRKPMYTNGEGFQDRPHFSYKVAF
jgi:hypothetical protein